MNTVDILKEAISKNEFLEFLRGEKGYIVRGRDSYFNGTDKAVALNTIYEYYLSNPNSSINDILEKTLLNLLNSNEKDIMTSFAYFTTHYLAEQNKSAPFSFKNESYRILQNKIEENKEKLKVYKESAEYGKYLSEGAYEYAVNLGNYLNSEYYQKSLWTKENTSGN